MGPDTKKISSMNTNDSRIYAYNNIFSFVYPENK